MFVDSSAAWNNLKCAKMFHEFFQPEKWKIFFAESDLLNRFSSLVFKRNLTVGTI